MQPFETFSDHLFLCFHLFSPATFSHHLFKTLPNITKHLKPYETFTNLSKHFKTFQNLSPFKTFNLSKPFKTFPLQNLSTQQTYSPRRACRRKGLFLAAERCFLGTTTTGSRLRVHRRGTSPPMSVIRSPVIRSGPSPSHPLALPIALDLVVLLRPSFPSRHPYHPAVVPSLPHLRAYPRASQ